MRNGHDELPRCRKYFGLVGKDADNVNFTSSMNALEKAKWESKLMNETKASAAYFTRKRTTFMTLSLALDLLWPNFKKKRLE